MALGRKKAVRQGKMTVERKKPEGGESWRKKLPKGMATVFYVATVSHIRHFPVVGADLK